MKITKLEENLPISEGSFVRFKDMGNIKEVMFSATKSTGGYIKKIDKDKFVDLRSGEIKEFNHIENRSQDLSNVAKSLCMGRDIINTNVTDVSKCRWLTFTYKENMTNPEKLMFDFKNCNKRLREIYGHYEYIACAEPQGRGAWHLHCIFIFPDKAPYMANDIVSNCWKKGFVTVKRLDDCDNVGAYLTAYLGDMDFTEFEKDNSNGYIGGIKEIEYKDENGEIKTKKYIKGGRLNMYPAGFHIFRYSKGIKKPLVENIPYFEAKKKISSAKLTFSKSVLLSDDDNGFNNTLIYEYYNSIRK